MRFIITILILLLPMGAFSATLSELERNVDKVFIAKSKSDLPKLVKNLTASLRTDKEKAYVLLAWIVKNIDYDDYKMRQIDKNNSSRLARKEVPRGQDIVETRLGVCEDIAALYDKMLALADVRGIVLSGCVGDNLLVNKVAGKCAGELHSWNAVWIDDQWELVDPTWAITGGEKKAMSDIRYKGAYNRELQKRTRSNSDTYKVRSNRQVDKRWFMVDPKTMEMDHYPTKPNKKWLLTSSKDRKNKHLK